MITFVRCRPGGLVPGPHEQQAGELAGGAGRRLEGDVDHAGDLAQPVAEVDTSSSSQPWVSAAGAAGWTSVRPGSEAASSHSLGLYFMVHDPSG